MSPQDGPTENAVDRSWSSTIKLGSVLGTNEDISRHKALATLALRSGQSGFDHTRSPKPLASACTTATSNQSYSIIRVHGLDSFHRRQLGNVLNIRYPHRISNKALYRRCKVQPSLKAPGQVQHAPHSVTFSMTTSPRPTTTTDSPALHISLGYASSHATERHE